MASFIENVRLCHRQSRHSREDQEYVGGRRFRIKTTQGGCLLGGKSRTKSRYGGSCQDTVVGSCQDEAGFISVDLSSSGRRLAGRKCVRLETEVGLLPIGRRFRRLFCDRWSTFLMGDTMSSVARDAAAGAARRRRERRYRSFLAGRSSWLSRWLH